MDSLFPLYENCFKRYQNRTCTILEIGCDKGGSLRLWKRLLGPYVLIAGLDIDPKCKETEEEQIHIEIGSQNDATTLNRLVSQYAPFDIVIDDGSHMMADIATSFQHLFQHTSKDGYYIVEDLHTAYWPESGGGLGESNSFIEFTKAVMDALHFFLMSARRTAGIRSFWMLPRRPGVFKSPTAWSYLKKGDRSGNMLSNEDKLNQAQTYLVNSRLTGRRFTIIRWRGYIFLATVNLLGMRLGSC